VNKESKSNLNEERGTKRCESEMKMNEMQGTDEPRQRDLEHHMLLLSAVPAAASAGLAP
jgi:hypothetical protein